MQVNMAMYTDGTMAVEVAVDNALVQWPFLADISFITVISAVFQLPPGEVPGAGVGAKAQAAEGTPWMYFNVLVTNSQIFVPLLDMERARDLAGRISMGMQTNAFEKVADLLLATMAISEQEPDQVAAFFEIHLESLYNSDDSPIAVCVWVWLRR